MITTYCKLEIFSFASGEDLVFKISLFDKATRTLVKEEAQNGLMKNGAGLRVLTIDLKNIFTPS
jgi:hypothetical protein